MIEITDGFTSISAGADSIEDPMQTHAPLLDETRTPRRPTGARVTVEFYRTSSLSPTQAVTVRHGFAADGICGNLPASQNPSEPSCGMVALCVTTTECHTGLPHPQ